MAAQEAAFLSNLHADLKRKKIPETKEDVETVIITTDSHSAKDLVGNRVFHSRSKHVLNKHHFISERVELGQIHIEFVYSESN